MISFSPGSIRSILCIGAHSDDIEIGCGGTILKLLGENPDVEVRWVVLSGSETRKEEARRSAQRFLESAARQNIELLDFRDAAFPYQDAMAIKSQFGALSRTCSPDLIFTHRREDLHQDHRLVSEMTWQHFRNHLILEYEIPKYEGDLGQPNTFVPLSVKWAQTKVDGIVSGFPSQKEKPWFDAETFSASMRMRGIECNSLSGFAEAFHCRKMLID